MALVSGPTSGSPAHYLDPDDKIISVKSGAPPASMFVLCVSMPGEAPLEILDSIGQNVRTEIVFPCRVFYFIVFCLPHSLQPAYGSAFSSNTRGYLVRKGSGQGQRSWCVLDGSTLLCYKQEEVKGGHMDVGVLKTTCLFSCRMRA